MELCPAHVSLVFLHMFFGRAWFCIDPCSTVLHVLLFSKRICQRSFVLLELLYVLLPYSRVKLWTSQTQYTVISTSTDQGAEGGVISFHSNNSYSQKVKPCGRTTRFSTELDWGHLAFRLEDCCDGENDHSFRSRDQAWNQCDKHGEIVFNDWSLILIG
jgi:hypothetical protein